MKELMEEIVLVSKLLYDRGYITSKEGNLSYRVGNEILITPSGKPKWNLSSDDIVRVNINKLKEGERGEASSEVFTHMSFYLSNPDARCILHAHPTNVISLNLIGYDFKNLILPEMEYFLGEIYVSDYATPGTPEGAKVVEGIKNDVVVLPKHGVLIKSKENLWEAFYKLEVLEKGSRIILNYLLYKEGKK
jgi:L-fuculose-phosphate aldolase